MEFHVTYKALIVAAMMCGIYLPSIEKLYGRKWYIKTLKCFFVFPAFTFIVYSVSGLKFIFFDNDGKLGNTMHGTVLFIFSTYSLFTSFSFFFNAANFEKVFQLWESLFQEDIFPEHRQALLDKNRNFTINWLKKFGGLSLGCVAAYFVVVYLNPEKKLRHPVGIPYRNQSPDYELVATLELLIGYFGFFTLIVYDSLTMALLSMEEAQFRHLKRSLAKLIHWVSVTNGGAIQVTVNENSKEVVIITDRNSPVLKGKFTDTEKYIQAWISQHKQVLQFHEVLRQIFFYPFTVKFLTFVLILCLFSFLSVTNSLTKEDIALGTVFCANIYATFYINISYADSTIEAASLIFEEAFANSWHLFPKKFQTCFHIILMRCHRPVHYVALKIYPLTARSFLKIFTSTYTFTTFLLQLNWKKERDLNQPN